MKKYIVLCLALLMGLALIAGCAQPAPAPSSKPSSAPAPAATHPQQTITLQAGTLGQAYYIWCVALEDVSQKHPWLRLSIMESPGAAWCMQYLNDKPETRLNTIVTGNDLEQWMAINGVISYKAPIPAAKDIRFLTITSVPAYTWVTFNSNIKTVFDLEGKNVGVGTDGQVGFYTIPTKLLDALNIHPKINKLGTDPAVQALIDGKVEASIISGYAKAPEYAQIIPPPAIMQLEGTGRKFYHVSWTEKVVEAAAKAFPGFKLNTYEIKPLALSKFQTESVWGTGHIIGALVDKTFPDDVAYEFVKLFIAHYQEFFPRHETMQTIIPQAITILDTAEIHPGALKAYREAGILK